MDFFMDLIFKLAMYIFFGMLAFFVLLVRLIFSGSFKDDPEYSLAFLIIGTIFLTVFIIILDLDLIP